MKKHTDVSIEPADTTHSPQPKVLSGWQLFAKATLLSFGITAVFLIITAVVLLGIAWSKLAVFLDTAGMSVTQLQQTIQEGLGSTSYNDKKTIVFLLLGLDSLETRPGSAALTDTLMYLVVNTQTATITTIPIPRDLWSPEYKTKVNALYYYGKDTYPNTPEKFTQEVLDNLSLLQTSHTIVITMDSVAEIIDTLGGLDVVIKEGFTDTEFPRTDVDVTQVTDPKLLYETVQFSEGIEHMSGKRALQYMRSRKSSDTQGTDTARNHRQQIVLESLVEKIASKDVITNPATMGKLVNMYIRTTHQYLPLPNVLALAKKLYPLRNQLQFKNVAIPTYPESEQGVLVNPPISKYKQWVYEIKDQETFATFFATVVAN